tara:strand:+ start:252 stop:446 length:195 start_codon:yes stop_codon:yes gene_type:complete
MVWNVLEVNFIYYLTRREKMDEGMIFVMIILFAFAFAFALHCPLYLSVFGLAIKINGYLNESEK